VVDAAQRVDLVEEPVVAAGDQPLHHAGAAAGLGRHGPFSRVLQGGRLGHQNLLGVDLACSDRGLRRVVIG
jgi:hypothetical protein